MAYAKCSALLLVLSYSFKLHCSKCGKLGIYGGEGGGPFEDPCRSDVHITAMEVAVGPLSGCATCLRFIQATYRYNHLILNII